MTLKGQIKKALNISEESFGHYCSDLQILYTKEVMDWLEDNYDFMANVKIHTSNVKGQDWYGKRFIEIPFAYSEYYE